MPCEDSFAAQNLVEMSRVFQMSSRPKKGMTEADVAEARKDLLNEQPTFTNEMFSAVLGPAVARVAREGSMHIGAQGQGSFAGPSANTPHPHS